MEPISQKEKIRFWKPNGLNGVEALTVENSKRRWRVFNTALSICTVKQGEAEWTHRGRNHRVTSRSIKLLDVGEPHNTYRAAGLGNFWVLLITPEAIAGISRDLLGQDTPRWCLWDIRDPALYLSFEKLHHVLASSAVTTIERESKMIECLIPLLSNYTEKTSRRTPPFGSKPLNLIREYVHEYFLENISLQDLANIGNIGKTYICRAFSKKFGIPPHRYLLDLRIAEAKKMISSGIKFTSADLGFCDQSQYIREFKKVMGGLTPLQYARQLHRK